MKRYDKYKPTGSPWIGEVPEHWEVKRFRFVCNYKKGKKPKNLVFDFEDGMKPYLSMDYLRGTSNDVEYTFHEEGLVESKAGDLLLLWDGSNAGEFIISKDGYLSSTCALLSNKFESNSYFGYLCNVSEKYLKDMTNGMGIPHVDANVFKNLTAIIPSQSEQESIVAYLDEKCGSIDKIIATQEKRVALLNELKQSVISEAVTRGINPDAPLKATGIEWIGQIPEHWEVMPLKRTLSEPLMYGANESPDNVDESNPRYIRITDIDENGKLKDDTFCTIDTIKAEPYMLSYGDILFARSGATVGKTYIHLSENPSCFAGYLIKATANDKTILPLFLYYYTKSGLYISWKDSINIQATIQNIGADKYSTLPVIVPCIKEQKEIVDYIETKVNPIDQMIAKAVREIELLREYKQSIITEAVTGKIKVC